MQMKRRKYNKKWKMRSKPKIICSVLLICMVLYPVCIIDTKVSAKDVIPTPNPIKREFVSDDTNQANYQINTSITTDTQSTQSTQSKQSIMQNKPVSTLAPEKSGVEQFTFTIGDTSYTWPLKFSSLNYSYVYDDSARTSDIGSKAYRFLSSNKFYIDAGLYYKDNINDSEATVYDLVFDASEDTSTNVNVLGISWGSGIADVEKIAIKTDKCYVDTLSETLCVKFYVTNEKVSTIEILDTGIIK